jgi:hypothetical protein
MQQSYTLSNGVKIIYTLLSIVIFGFGILILLLNKTPAVSYLIYVLPVLVLGMAVLILMTAFRKKVIVEDGYIKSFNAFNQDELPVENIMGYRLESKNIVLQSKTGSNITIRNYKDFAGSNELLTWATGIFNNLDAIDKEAEKERLLQDVSIGATPEERTARLERVTQVAMSYNIIGCVLGIAMILFHFKWMVILVICCPLAGIVILFKGNGLIKFYANPKRSIHPFMLFGFLMPAFVLLIRALVNYNLFRTDNLWMPAIVTGIVVFILLFLSIAAKSGRPAVIEMLLMLIIVTIYSVGSVLQVNCFFDDSQQQVYDAKIYDKKVTHGKSAGYYLKLSKWGPQTEVKSVSVGRSFFRSTLIGDTVKVHYKEGKLNVPWFVVTK